MVLIVFVKSCLQVQKTKNPGPMATPAEKKYAHKDPKLILIQGNYVASHKLAIAVPVGNGCADPSGARRRRARVAADSSSVSSSFRPQSLKCRDNKAFDSLGLSWLLCFCGCGPLE